MRGWVRSLLAIGLVLACSDPVGVREGTEVSFTVSPGEVEAGGALVATLRIKNVSGSPLSLMSGYGCISFLNVHEAPFGYPLKGTDFYCLTVFTEFPLRAGETLTWSWDLEARWSSGALLEPGDYHLEAALEVRELDHPIVSFRVIDGS